MKHFRLFATLSVAAGILLLSSCNSKKDKKADENKTDSTVVTTQPNNQPVANPSGPASVMIVRHKVADYAKWKPGYDAHDSARLANGLHSYLIGRGTEDSNNVLVAMTMDDVDKAKAFASNPDLKNVMKKAGVIGAPSVIDFLDAVMSDTSMIQASTRLMVRHKVKDWDAWKKVFDADKQNRMDAGLTDRVVAHTAGDTHSVTVVFAVADVEKAKSMMTSQALKDKMKEAGVEGAPDFFFYKIVQKYQ